MSGQAVHFYGNSGVCIFKYLVTSTYPQRVFSLSILTLNFLCLLVISTCYILIQKQSRGSTTPGQNSTRSTQARALQVKIALIIFTDFLAWAPFTIICFLHYAEVNDATDWYPFFSAVVLPLNSMINPILYNSALFKYLYSPLASMSKHFSASRSWFVSHLSFVTENQHCQNRVEHETDLSGSKTDNTRLLSFSIDDLGSE